MEKTKSNDLKIHRKQRRVHKMTSCRPETCRSSCTAFFFIDHAHQLPESFNCVKIEADSHLSALFSDFSLLHDFFLLQLFRYFSLPCDFLLTRFFANMKYFSHAMFLSCNSSRTEIFQFWQRGVGSGDRRSSVYIFALIYSVILSWASASVLTYAFRYRTPCRPDCPSLLALAALF